MRILRSASFSGRERYSSALQLFLSWHSSSFSWCFSPLIPRGDEQQTYLVKKAALESTVVIVLFHTPQLNTRWIIDTITSIWLPKGVLISSTFPLGKVLNRQTIFRRKIFFRAKWKLLLITPENLTYNECSAARDDKCLLDRGS